MFNLFKSKIELKNTNNIMSSFYTSRGIKLGSEILVHDNFQGLVFNKGKLYKTLDSGKYKMDKDTFATLIDNQKTKKAKIKHIKCVIHYINTTPQTIEIKLKKQKISIEFVISSAIKFAEFILLYEYKVDNNYVFNTLYDTFKELLHYFKGDINQISKDQLSPYGITINNIDSANGKISIFNSNSSNVSNSSYNIIQNNGQTSDDNNTNNATSNNFESNLKPPETEIQNPPNIEVEPVNQSSNQSSNTYTCPNCNHTARFSTTYCLRCGFKLK